MSTGEVLLFGGMKIAARAMIWRCRDGSRGVWSLAREVSIYVAESDSHFDC
jgi:hypothetical protein